MKVVYVKPANGYRYGVPRFSRVIPNGGLWRVRNDLPLKTKGTALDHSTGTFSRNRKVFVPVQPLEARKRLSLREMVTYVPADRITEDWVSEYINRDCDGNKEKARSFILNSGYFTISEVARLRKEGVFSGV